MRQFVFTNKSRIIGCNAFLFSQLLVLLILFFSTNVQANTKWKSTVKKTIEKEFIVNSDVKLTIDHKYGNVIIVEGGSNKVEMTITATLNSNRNNSTTNIDDCFKIDFDATKSHVEATTRYDMSKKKSNESLTIEYYITVPQYFYPNINLKYGDLALRCNANKGSNLDIAYGKLLAQKMGGDVNNINMKYSDIEANEINRLNLSISYGNVDITSSDRANIESKYTDIFFDKAGNINITSGYGELKIGEVDNILMGSISYGDIDIDRVNGTFDSDGIAYTDTYIGVASSAKEITLTSKYSDIDIELFSKQQFHAKLSGKYADVDIDSSLELNNDRKTIIESGSSFDYDVNNIKKQ